MQHVSHSHRQEITAALPLFFIRKKRWWMKKKTGCNVVFENESDPISWWFLVMMIIHLCCPCSSLLFSHYLLILVCVGTTFFFVYCIKLFFCLTHPITIIEHSEQNDPKNKYRWSLSCLSSSNPFRFGFRVMIKKFRMKRWVEHQRFVMRMMEQHFRFWHDWFKEGFRVKQRIMVNSGEGLVSVNTRSVSEK
jgi:hypothetical protein